MYSATLLMGGSRSTNPSNLGSDIHIEAAKLEKSHHDSMEYLGELKIYASSSFCNLKVHIKS